MADDDDGIDVNLRHLLVRVLRSASDSNAHATITFVSKSHTVTSTALADWSAFTFEQTPKGHKLLMSGVGRTVEELQQSYDALVMLRNATKSQARFLETIVNIVEETIETAPDGALIRGIVPKKAVSSDGKAAS